MLRLTGVTFSRRWGGFNPSACWFIFFSCVTYWLTFGSAPMHWIPSVASLLTFSSRSRPKQQSNTVLTFYWELSGLQNSYVLWGVRMRKCIWENNFCKNEPGFFFSFFFQNTSFALPRMHCTKEQAASCILPSQAVFTAFRNKAKHDNVVQFKSSGVTLTPFRQTRSLMSN